MHNALLLQYSFKKKKKYSQMSMSKKPEATEQETSNKVDNSNNFQFHNWHTMYDANARCSSRGNGDSCSRATCPPSIK